MTSLTWVGGGNNKASNPLDWSPHQAPEPGDFLRVLAIPASPGPFTMNVGGNDLTGDPLSINLFVPSSFTANLSHKAVMSAFVSPSHATFNLSQDSTLDVSTSYGTAMVNISGNDTATISPWRGGAIVNLEDGAKWNGTFSTAAGIVTVEGGADSAFNNNGTSFEGSSDAAGSSATIGVDVIGSGDFQIASSSHIEFAKSVGPNQSISDGGWVQIDQPNQFDASVTLVSSSSVFAPSPAEIDLMGLTTADSYSYKNDMLNIFSGNKIIDTLRLHDSTQYGFVVEPPETRGTVSIVAIADPTNPLPSLPIHIDS